jgi:hypothetical protein
MTKKAIPLVNHWDTRGIICLPSKKRMIHIGGWFDKNYLKEIVKYLDSFDGGSVSLAYVPDEEDSAVMFLILPDKESDVALAVCGRYAP